MGEYHIKEKKNKNLRDTSIMFAGKTTTKVTSNMLYNPKHTNYDLIAKFMLCQR